MKSEPSSRLERSRFRSRGQPRAPILRDVDYLASYGCYPRSAVIELEIDRSITPGSLSFRVLKLSFDTRQGRQRLCEVSSKDWVMAAKGEKHFNLSLDVDAGYYLLVVAEGAKQSGFPFVVNENSGPADVAVVRPVFTQWSYHSDGFYFNEKRPLLDRALIQVSRLGPPGRLTDRALRKVARRLNFPGVNFPFKSFPANAEINLKSFYRRNNRWDRSLWDCEWGRLEGMWIDEVISGMAVFALLEKNGVPYHVFTDVDLHNQNKKLESYRVLIFAGQEGITPSYYEALKQLQTNPLTSFLVWGVQGFGYRQLDYNTETGALKYVCTRGHQGMWGDRLEDLQPVWVDEAQLFGFHFPEPQSATWRYDRLYSEIQVAQWDHPIVISHRTSGGKYSYAVRDLAGQNHPGLTWAGGEVQQRVRPEASVIAHLDDERELIGIGEYRNTVFFAPTYLPGFFAYQAHTHPEVEAWFMAALDYLTGKKTRCGSA